MALSHFDTSGKAHMVDVSDKNVTSRIAVAEGFITMTAQTLALITEGRADKGDVLGIARLAGIMGGSDTGRQFTRHSYLSHGQDNRQDRRRDGGTHGRFYRSADRP